jgi:hypothetical protein
MYPTHRLIVAFKYQTGVGATPTRPRDRATTAAGPGLSTLNPFPSTIVTGPGPISAKKWRALMINTL